MRQTLDIKLELNDGARTFKIVDVYLGKGSLIVIAQLHASNNHTDALMAAHDSVTVETFALKELPYKVYFINATGRPIPQQSLANNYSVVSAFDKIVEIKNLAPLQKVVETPNFANSSTQGTEDLGSTPWMSSGREPSAAVIDKSENKEKLPKVQDGSLPPETKVSSASIFPKEVKQSGTDSLSSEDKSSSAQQGDSKPFWRNGLLHFPVETTDDEEELRVTGRVLQ